MTDTTCEKCNDTGLIADCEEECDCRSLVRATVAAKQRVWDAVAQYRATAITDPDGWMWKDSAYSRALDELLAAINALTAVYEQRIAAVMRGAVAAREPLFIERVS